jgi:hypothetical protein
LEDKNQINKVPDSQGAQTSLKSPDQDQQNIPFAQPETSFSGQQVIEMRFSLVAESSVESAIDEIRAIKKAEVRG